ncbi:dipeptide epimerase [Paremcibacter congregatus]|uniref:Dipeptide epimerase n=1 Tax=Paremcibacter congregatus TaxID=2043170 RepID=A0A2G4YVW0_9PROT|nr:dipeptide epimerase [Paremcibacter congregatus]PHZ86380.1 dipeptide epimerase [Paremcibacter congregatus]QDE28523.1 dipeptide epimerase [Paremcibacter congregatus]
MKLSIYAETWQLRETFRIAHHKITHSYIIRVVLQDGAIFGQGEAEAHDVNPDEMDIVVKEIQKVKDLIEQGRPWPMIYPSVHHLRARNALDCMYWDFEANRNGIPVWQKIGHTKPKPLTTAYTIGIDTAEKMESKAFSNRHRKLLKIKLGCRQGDMKRIEGVRRAAPNSDLIIDANEGWTFDQLIKYAPYLHQLGVKLIEQPLPAENDYSLVKFKSPVALCADESCHTRADLPNLIDRYQFVNIKLDKTGGLTEALLLASDAKKAGLRLMTGCMVGTSLAMAPAMLIGSLSEFVDLDGPLLLREDRKNGLQYCDVTSSVYSSGVELWGERI